MNILRLSATAALGFALLSANAPAQQNSPLPPPSNPGLTSVAPLSSAIQSPLPPLGAGVVTPIPLPTPQLLAPSNVFTNCTLNCGTQAMNCRGTCVPVTGSAAASPTAPAGVTSSCKPQLYQSGACLQNILRSRAVVPAVNRT